MASPKGVCYNPAGRPHKPFDKKIFEDLCAIQCTQEEIASIMHIDIDTLTSAVKRTYNDAYSVIYKRYAAPGKSSLRRDQFKMAKRNATMAIWLGKQYLDQKDQQPAQIVTEEILNNYQQMIDQLRAIQASKSSSSTSNLNESSPNKSSTDSSSSSFSSA